MPADWVGLMAKWPEAGMVKTRLAAEIGEQLALRVYCRLLDNVLARCSPSESDTYRLGCFVTPGQKCRAFAERFPGYAFCYPQGEGNLGQRMQAALAHLLAQPGAKKAVLIGADIPLLGREQLRQAFEELDSHDVVWGPTDDGGYYLIGVSRWHETIFNDIDWGTEKVLKQSMEAAERSHVSFSLLEPLHDLDTVDDLARFDFLVPEDRKKR
ncbi:MAG: glycosyltransferase [Candidatus Zixiibacteriota bacterium]|nr:MAG: glycosyltransferase [candidate division Zixibacteria bacterium]